MDSSGVGVLLGRYKLFALKKMYIYGAKGSVDRVLKLSGVYLLMPKKEDKK
jgi:anti-anti-sigma regulatory factor